MMTDSYLNTRQGIRDLHRGRQINGRTNNNQADCLAHYWIVDTAASDTDVRTPTLPVYRCRYCGAKREY